MQKHLLVVAVILTTGTGCDNVEFGGLDIALRAPESATGRTRVALAPLETAEEPDTDRALLLAGMRQGATGRFIVVGEVDSDTLRPFPNEQLSGSEERMAKLIGPGSEWAVFSEGVRVGRMIAQSTSPAIGFCGARTAISGVVELVATAASAERLLAMPADEVNQPYEEYREISDTYEQRVATLAIAGDAIPRYGAQWPELGMLNARDHIQAFQLRNTPGQSIAATFMIGDNLEVGDPGQGAYSLFVMGHENDSGYVESYTWFHDTAEDGKAAPRYFDHLDWDGDGLDEILLDVFGDQKRSFAALSRQGDRWVRTYQDNCAES